MGTLRVPHPRRCEMKDIITNQKITVEIDSVYGPLITLNDYNQFDELDDILTEIHSIEYDVRFLKDSDGNEKHYQMFFDNKSDIANFQKILDDLSI